MEVGETGPCRRIEPRQTFQEEINQEEGHQEEGQEQGQAENRQEGFEDDQGLPKNNSSGDRVDDLEALNPPRNKHGNGMQWPITHDDFWLKHAKSPISEVIPDSHV